MRCCRPQLATLFECIKFVCSAQQHVDKFESGSHCHEILQVKYKFHKSQLYFQSTVACYSYALWLLDMAEKKWVGLI